MRHSLWVLVAITGLLGCLTSSLCYDTFPMDMELSASPTAPRVGESVTIVLRFTPFMELPKYWVQFDLSEGLELAEGEMTWSGCVKKGQRRDVSLVIRPVESGRQWIGCAVLISPDGVGGGNLRSLTFDVGAQEPAGEGPDILWTRTYGGVDLDWGSSVQHTSDGGYIIVGTWGFVESPCGDVYLIRTDSVGNTIWTKTYGGTGSDHGKSVQQTSDGGYIIAGYTYSFGTGGCDVYLIKTDANGDTLWTRTYGGIRGDGVYSVQQTSDGGYVAAGWTVSFGAGDADVYLIKTDADGDTVWTKTYGGKGDDKSFSVQQTSDGGYILTGHRESPQFRSNVYLIKTDANGDTLWTRTYEGSSDDEGKSVQQTSDGGYIVVGKTYVFYYDVYLIKTDENGDTVWTKTFGEAGNECGEAVQQTSDSGYIIAAGVHLIKTDASGNTIWKKAYDDLYAHSVKQTSDNGYIITGRTSRPGAGDYDVYVIKTKPEIHME